MGAHKKFAGLLFAFMAVTLLTGAQEPWTLQQCIQHALDNNLQVKQQELAVKQSEQGLLRAKLNRLPSANINANHSYSFGRGTNYITNTKERRDMQSTSFSISSGVTLFNGFQLTNSKRKAEFDLKASSFDVEKIRNSIALSVASAYLQILYQQELVELQQRQVEQSKMQVERTAVLVNAGSLPEGNLYEVEALLASDELQLVNAQNKLEIDYLNLTQLLELDSISNFTILKPDISDIEKLSLPANPNRVFETALQQMPQILGAEQRLRSSEIGLKIAKGAYYPRLQLTGSYGTGAQRYINSGNSAITSDPYSTQFKDNANTSVGLSLSIPLFNGGNTRYQVASAHISLDNSRLQLEQEKKKLYKDIQQAYTDAVAAQKRYNASLKNKQSAEESFRYTENKFTLGLVNALDYTTSRNNLAKAETELLQAKYEFVFKVKILDFYMGNPLSL